MQPAHNQPEYSVSEIAGALKRVVEENFSYVRVRGEISKYSVNAGSGHAYLTLKDDKAVLDGVCWRGTVSKLAIAPEAGMEVIATGRLSTYPGSSKYQIIIEAMEPAGIGALMAMLEARKKQFAAEGLFDAARKKPLPYLPARIGVVTSPTGAVIRDILHRIADRFPSHVVLWPVAVQGAQAAAQIAAAIDGFAAMPEATRPDILIVGRGGGSIEDLWAFNEEIVVRAVARCAIPVISAVGHETDTTLIDYVADMRAPTPTAAAEMAVPVRSELISLNQQAAMRLNAALRRVLEIHIKTFEHAALRLQHFPRQLENYTQRFDEWVERFYAGLPQLFARHTQRLGDLSVRLAPRLLLQPLLQHETALRVQFDALTQRSLRAVEQQSHRLALLVGQLEAYNPHHVLKRGFVLVKNAKGMLVSSAEHLPKTGKLTLQFHDGERSVTPVSTTQGDLF
jgi:exodeoxyribonuclease VII large subunit